MPGAGGLQGNNPPPAPVLGWDDEDNTPGAGHDEFEPNRPPGIHLPEDFEAIAPVDFFKLFFSVALVESIATFTNNYAVQHIVKFSTYGDRYGAWIDTDVQEIYCLLGLLMYCGISRLPSFEHYWKTSSLYHGSWARRFISSYRRFKALLAFLHIVGPADEDAADKMTKVRYVYDQLRHTCRELYQPQQQLAVDERMVKCKGRISFKQYIKNKPVRWGFKQCALCCSKTGYLWDFEVYTGRQNQQQAEHGLAHNVVVRMCEPFDHQGYEVYHDQFYTSPALAETLSDLGIKCVGTCQSNRRNFPEQLRNVKQWDKLAQRGAMRFVGSGDKLFIQWKDKRTVTVLSTLH